MREKKGMIEIWGECEDWYQFVTDEKKEKPYEREIRRGLVCLSMMIASLLQL